MNLPKVVAYTDGSAIRQVGNPKKYHGGAGVVLVYKGKMKEISHPIPESTNNVAELTACLLALKALKQKCNIKIVTDSKYCIQCMTVWLNGWKSRGWKTANKGEVKNKDLIQELDRLCQQHIVEWEWVKGHSNHPMNDLADKLACQASESLKIKELGGDS